MDYQQTVTLARAVVKTLGDLRPIVEAAWHAGDTAGYMATLKMNDTMRGYYWALDAHELDIVRSQIAVELRR